MSASWLQGLRRRQQPAATRWIMIDVETTGLDPRSDELLCVAALAMDLRHDAPQLVVADSFEVVLRQSRPTASHDNVLLHGIGWGQQRQGLPAIEALTQLSQWVGDSPLLAYHAAFDQQVLQQAFKRQRLAQPHWSWLDLADLLPAAFPALEARSLDHWMQALGVRCVQRHQAAADVWACAQLFLKAWPQWQSQGLSSWAALARQADEVRWLRVSASAARL
jgi:DNA polymerase-3 subunit epsilon